MAWFKDWFNGLSKEGKAQCIKCGAFYAIEKGFAESGFKPPASLRDYIYKGLNEWVNDVAHKKIEVDL